MSTDTCQAETVALAAPCLVVEMADGQALDVVMEVPVVEVVVEGAAVTVRIWRRTGDLRRLRRSWMLRWMIIGDRRTKRRERLHRLGLLMEGTLI